jgi:hypothetical protein
MKGDNYTNSTIRLHCQPELVEGGFTNQRCSFPIGTGFDKLNLTTFIRA